MSGTSRRCVIVVAWLCVLPLPVAQGQSPGGQTVDPDIVRTSLAQRPEPISVPPRSGPRGGPLARGENAAGWWFGPVGIAAALAVVGGISLASKRFNLNLGIGAVRDLGSVGVVGQTRLSPKHAVYLVRVGDRVLIVGAGQGGSPATLGEVTDPTELARLIPRRVVRPGTTASSAPAIRAAGSGRPTGFDQRIGDDE